MYWLANVVQLSIALFSDPPSFPLVAAQKIGRGPGILSHMSDIRIERSFNCTWVKMSQNTEDTRITYHTYLASWGWISHTASIESVEQTVKCCLLFLKSFDYIMLMWKKRTRLSWFYHTASNRKLGGGLGAKLIAPSLVAPSTNCSVVTSSMHLILQWVGKYTHAFPVYLCTLMYQALGNLFTRCGLLIAHEPSSHEFRNMGIICSTVIVIPFFTIVHQILHIIYITQTLQLCMVIQFKCI